MLGCSYGRIIYHGTVCNPYTHISAVCNASIYISSICRRCAKLGGSHRVMASAAFYVASHNSPSPVHFGRRVGPAAGLRTVPTRPEAVGPSQTTGHGVGHATVHATSTWIAMPPRPATRYQVYEFVQCIWNSWWYGKHNLAPMACRISDAQ